MFGDDKDLAHLFHERPHHLRLGRTALQMLLRFARERSAWGHASILQRCATPCKSIRSEGCAICRCLLADQEMAHPFHGYPRSCCPDGLLQRRS